MEINEFRKLIECINLTDEDGGCALVMTKDSNGRASAIIKGKAKELYKLFVSAMLHDTDLRECILGSVQRYEEISKEEDKEE